MYSNLRWVFLTIVGQHVERYVIHLLEMASSSMFCVTRVRLKSPIQTPHIIPFFSRLVNMVLMSTGLYTTLVTKRATSGV